MPNFKVTVVKSDRPVNKVFPKEEGRDNTFSSGVAATKEFTPESFLSFLNESDPDTCIITGLHNDFFHYIIEPRPYAEYLLSKGTSGSINGEYLPISSRGLDTFTYDRHVNGFLHIDVDNKDGMTYLQPEELLDLLTERVPELSYCTKIVKHSSSNVTAKGKQSKQGNYHIYIVVPMRCIKNLGIYLHRKMVIDGYGHLYYSKSFTPQRGGYVDKTCFSPERVIYTAPPTLKDDNLTYHHKAYIIESKSDIAYDDLVQKFANYDPAEIEGEYNDAWDSLKSKHADETARLKAEYQNGKEQEYIADGYRPDVAKTMAEREAEDILTYDHKVKFDKLGWLTIREAIDKDLKGATCADPIEYDHPKNGGPNKAMLRYSRSKGWYIHSMIHGGIDYSIEEDVAKDLDEYKLCKPQKEKVEKTKFLKTGICINFERKANRSAIQSFVFDSVENTWTCCQYNFTTFEDLLENTLAIMSLSGTSEIVREIKTKERRSYAHYENSRISNQIVKIVLDELKRELKAEAKVKGRNKLRKDLIDGCQDSIKRLVQILLVNAVVEIDTKPSALKKTSLRNKGVKVHHDSMYFEHKPWTDKLPRIIDIMVRRGFIDCKMEGRVAFLAIKNKMALISHIFSLLQREVKVDDSSIYYEATPPSKTKKKKPYYVEQSITGTHADYAMTIENCNRMASKMSFSQFFPNARLVLSSETGSTDFDSYRIIELESTMQDHYHSQGKKLELVEIDNLHELMACTHDIYCESLKNVRTVFMKTKENTIGFTKQGYWKHGIPMIMSTQGIYTDERGKAICASVKGKLSLDAFVFHHGKMKKKTDKKWWQ